MLQYNNREWHDWLSRNMHWRKNLQLMIMVIINAISVTTKPAVRCPLSADPSSLKLLFKTLTVYPIVKQFAIGLIVFNEKLFYKLLQPVLSVRLPRLLARVNIDAICCMANKNWFVTLLQYCLVCESVREMMFNLRRVVTLPNNSLSRQRTNIWFVWNKIISLDWIYCFKDYFSRGYRTLRTAWCLWEILIQQLTNGVHDFSAWHNDRETRHS